MINYNSLIDDLIYSGNIILPKNIHIYKLQGNYFSRIHTNDTTHGYMLYLISGIHSYGISFEFEKEEFNPRMVTDKVNDAVKKFVDYIKEKEKR